MLKKIVFIGLVFLLMFKFTIAQKKYSLIILNRATNKNVKDIVSYKTIFSDSLQRDKELHKVVISIWEKGYVSATCDSILIDSLTLNVFIDFGVKYNYLLNPIDDKSNTATFENNNKIKQNFSDFIELEKQINRTLLLYENNGYPFVNVKLDCIDISDSSFFSKLIINKNNKYFIDSVVVRGNAQPSAEFIKNYLHIKNKSIYNETINRKITKKIKELDFIKETKPFEIEFYENKAKIILFIDKVKANQFDGIIGFMPNNENGKLLITGDIKLLLSNSFNRGEIFAIKWYKFDKLSQNLKIAFSYPFLFASPFGFEIDYSLFKKDTSYITNKVNLGFKYIFEGNNHLKAFYELQNTNIISKNFIGKDSILPIYSPSKNRMYGLEFKIQSLNNLINPRKGYFIKIMASAGNKEIIKDKELPEAIYNRIKPKSSLYLYNAEVSYYIPVISRSCIYLNTKSALIQNKYLFDSDVFRIGGLKTIKGFDEESIMASFYTILTIEYRYLFDEYSYLNAFWNGCYYEKNTISKFKSDYPFGFGAGINFKTKLGVFSINYALGKQGNEPIYLKRGKIHFGIINYF